MRDGDQLVEASWSAALERAATAIREAMAVGGPESVAVIGGARLTNEDAYAWAKLAKSVIGTDNVDAQLGDGLSPSLVAGLPTATIDEACAAGTLLVLAPDLKEELPVLVPAGPRRRREAPAAGHRAVADRDVAHAAGGRIAAVPTG